MKKPRATLLFSLATLAACAGGPRAPESDRYATHIKLCQEHSLAGSCVTAGGMIWRGESSDFRPYAWKLLLRACELDEGLFFRVSDFLEPDDDVRWKELTVVTCSRTDSSRTVTKDLQDCQQQATRQRETRRAWLLPPAEAEARCKQEPGSVACFVVKERARSDAYEAKLEAERSEVSRRFAREQQAAQEAERRAYAAKSLEERRTWTRGVCDFTGDTEPCFKASFFSLRGDADSDPTYAAALQRHVEQKIRQCVAHYTREAEGVAGVVVRFVEECNKRNATRDSDGKFWELKFAGPLGNVASYSCRIREETSESTSDRPVSGGGFVRVRETRTGDVRRCALTKTREDLSATSFAPAIEAHCRQVRGRLPRQTEPSGPDNQYCN